MTDQIVITEKTSQAKDVRAAVGTRYGPVLPAEGHLFDLEEPEDAVPAWKRWSTTLLRPEGLYGTRPAQGGNKAAKLKAIRDALRKAKRVWLATDCDREGQLIGQEILEHYKYRGTVMRVMFTAQDPQTIRDAFARAKPNSDYAPLYAAAVARRQADQIYNLSLTRTATVTLAPGARAVIGVGRVKTPTLAIVCRRELEIRHFVPEAYFEVVATAEVEAGQFRMRHAPKQRILKRPEAEAIAALAEGFSGPLAVKVEDKRQSPPRLHDLPSLQRLCGSRFGWSAARTLELAQALYDGEGKKVITYPRAETRYLPESLIPDVPRIVAGLRAGRAYEPIPVPEPPLIRRGAGGAFHDKGLAGASHHAIIPNVNTVDGLREIWPRLTGDERRLFDVIARTYLAAMMPDYRYRQTTATLDVTGHVFRAVGRQPLEPGWRAAFPDWTPAEEKGEDAQLLPRLRDGEAATLRDAKVEDKETRPPPRYNEGTLIEAMQNAWRFVEDEALQDRLKEAKGIGTPATRAEIIRGLKAQDFLMADGKHIVPTERGLALFGVLERADPALVDPGVTAQMELLLDQVLVGQQEMVGAIDAVCAQASRIIGRLTAGAGAGGGGDTALLAAATTRPGRPSRAGRGRAPDGAGGRATAAGPAGSATGPRRRRVTAGRGRRAAPRRSAGAAPGRAVTGPPRAPRRPRRAVPGGGPLAPPPRRPRATRRCGFPSATRRSRCGSAPATAPAAGTRRPASTSPPSGSGAGCDVPRWALHGPRVPPCLRRRSRRGGSRGCRPCRIRRRDAAGGAGGGGGAPVGRPRRRPRPAAGRARRGRTRTTRRCRMTPVDRFRRRPTEPLAPGMMAFATPPIDGPRRASPSGSGGWGRAAAADRAPRAEPARATRSRRRRSRGRIATADRGADRSRPAQSGVSSASARAERCMSGVAGSSGYEANAATLAEQYESITFEQVHADVLHRFPAAPCAVLDIGAGSGRDAAALARRGHRVTAVEPTAGMRQQGQARHAGLPITWINDSLPDLARLRARDEVYDLVLLTAVWMHLDARERARAMPEVAALLAPGGEMVMALRHGPVPAGRRMFDVSAAETAALGAAHGLRETFRTRRADTQGRADVHWSVLCLGKPAAR